MEKSAIIEGNYRYSLRREWGPGSFALFCMLNPSTADAFEDDATIRRCMAFSKSWGCGALRVVNAFAWRSTDPKALMTAPDPIGPKNDSYILSEAQGATFIVAAWGSNAKLDRAISVMAMLKGLGPVYCLGVTVKGYPKHPLYLPSNTQLVPYSWPLSS